MSTFLQPPVEDERCNNSVTNNVEKYRDLIELQIGLYYAVWDLMDMENDPHSAPQ